jgi:RNA polymerase sigma factor (sigma-70 family)
MRESHDTNPFKGGDNRASDSLDARDADDASLAQAAAGGNRSALETLLGRHQKWVFSLCLRFMLNPDDSRDIAQEAIIKIITHIAKFEGRSAFRTWAYRIVVNTCLDAKKGRLEELIYSFDQYGQELDSIPLGDLNLPGRSDPEQALIVEEAKLSCMLGMLLCLSREQRMAYVLSEIFEASSADASKILGVSEAAYRQRLKRARDDLTSFMNDKCGLVNEANPCRCSRKTNSFIKAGWLEPDKLKFTAAHLQRLSHEARKKSEDCDRMMEDRYAAHFQDSPLHEGIDSRAILSTLIQNPETRQIFDL